MTRSESPLTVNLNALRTILTNSFGRRAIETDGPVVFVRRDSLPAKVKKKYRWREAAAGFTEDGDLLMFVTLDITPSEIDPDKLMRAVYEANNTGVDYGSFMVFEDRDHIRFKVGLSGAAEAVVPAVILTDTFAYTLNMAEEGEKFIRDAVSEG